jgi:hypothetical protein
MFFPVIVHLSAGLWVYNVEPSLEGWYIAHIWTPLFEIFRQLDNVKLEMTEKMPTIKINDSEEKHDIILTHKSESAKIDILIAEVKANSNEKKKGGPDSESTIEREKDILKVMKTMSNSLNEMKRITTPNTHQDLRSYGKVMSGYQVSILEAQLIKGTNQIDIVVIYGVGNYHIAKRANDCPKLWYGVRSFMALKRRMHGTIQLLNTNNIPV